MIDPRLLDAIGDFLLPRLNGARPFVLGVAGSQGSGKSTLAAELARQYGGVSLSLDDVYLTRNERVAMARDIHPLFATRGAPGTHDLGLLYRVLNALETSTSGSQTALPAFDKLADERLPQDQWPVISGRPRLIVLEGSCLGALPQPPEALIEPANALEAEADGQMHWRTYVNEALAGEHVVLRRKLDALVYLRAPDINTVLDWRCQQEAELLGVSELPQVRRASLDLFVAHFERLTVSMMQGGIDADLTFDLDKDRRVLAIAARPTT